ncbi:hypothetical protein [Megasphaera vaginalis (ex Srinivasan et al. 2021)]|uniref:Uncharacterized protein n=1 Tax=Megasphaera vaginalis (ex Srinivasan et al. 2021) TaxID=1111454 RepID=U7UL38_9FIRM|nr:hypothetical protein [Megasphaera vaginalis (ex Srinivasan et al. 2021)]ERT60021.1 hypothetical protein HMPREF1250_0944 [Megasphaera vaginalis (ex Srinivasan et al. 2021)]
MDYKAIYLGMGSTIKTLFSALPIKLAGSAASAPACNSLLCLCLSGIPGLLHSLDEH